MDKVSPASTMATKINKPEAEQHALERQSNDPPSVGDEDSEWEKIHLPVPEPAMQKKEQAKKAVEQPLDTSEAVPSQPVTAKSGERPFDFSLPVAPPQALLPSIDFRGTGQKPQTAASNPASQKQGRTRKPKDHLRIMKKADPKQSMPATFDQRPFQFQFSQLSISQPEEPSRADRTEEEPETEEEEEEEIHSHEQTPLDK
jgi:hypothetical protein